MHTHIFGAQLWFSKLHMPDWTPKYLSVVWVISPVLEEKQKQNKKQTPRLREVTMTFPWPLCLKQKGRNSLCVPKSCCSVAKLCLTLRPYRLQHARFPCPSLSPGICPNSCPLIPWCYPIVSSSAFPLSFYLQSFQASVSFPMSQLSASGDQSFGGQSILSLLPPSCLSWVYGPWSPGSESSPAPALLGQLIHSTGLCLSWKLAIILMQLATSSPHWAYSYLCC